MAKVNVNIQIELNDEELKEKGLTAEQYAESLTTFPWDFEGPSLVITQDVDHPKHGDKIVQNISWILEAKAIED